MELPGIWFFLIIVMIAVALAAEVFFLLCGWLNPFSPSSFSLPSGGPAGSVATWAFCRKNMTEDAFIQRINDWMAGQPSLLIHQIRFDCGHGVSPFTYRNYLNAVELQYTCMPEGRQYQYGIAPLKRFGLRRCSPEEVLAQWKKVNQGAEVLAASGAAVFQRGHGSLSPYGIGDDNLTQLYILYRFPRV